MIDAVLRRFWPEETQTLLLTAALGAPTEASAAWRKWLSRRNLDEVGWPEVRLLATVARRMAQFEGSPALPRIQGIRRFVWTRTQMCLAKTRPLLAALGEAGLRMMLIKGAARLALEPSSAADRFINDVDVLVYVEHWRDALDVAHRAGWRAWMHGIPDKSLRGSQPGLHSFPYQHAVDFRRPGPGHLNGSVDLHSFALLLCRNVGDDDGLWARAEPAALQGIRFFVPSPTDQLLLTLAHGLLFDPNPVADWALDASALMRSGTVDWDLLERETAVRDLDPYIASTLMFLSERLRVDIPLDTLARMRGRVREPFLSEFQTFATAYAPADEAAIDRVREAASARACKAADTTGAVLVSGQKRVLPGTAWKRLPPEGSQATLEIPGNFPPRSLLRLEVGFTMDEVPQGKRAGIEIAAPGMVLKRWLNGQPAASFGSQSKRARRKRPKALMALKRWSSGLTGPFASFVRLVLRKASAASVLTRNWWYRARRRPISTRHVVNFEVPAALFEKRGIRTITLRAVGRWLIEDVSVRWVVSDL
jgi:Uncharacterised nucleotidyltransferase